MAVYRVVTTVETAGEDAEGNPIVIAPGAVINRIVWDGETPYDPGPGLMLEPESP